MKLVEYGFTDYYHKYIIFEADDITEYTKGKIRVTEKDCYMLCSCFIDQDGLLSFNVLSIGSSYESCKKGLKKPEMLAVFGPDFVMDLECKIIEPTLEMMQKNNVYIEIMEQYADEDLMATRFDDRLDEVRDVFFPDVVAVGILTKQNFGELEMQITGINGPFLEGNLINVPEDAEGVQEGDLVRALPYYIDCPRLIGVFVGKKLSKADQKQYKKLMKLGKEAIFGFSKPILRS